MANSLAMATPVKRTCLAGKVFISCLQSGSVDIARSPSPARRAVTSEKRLDQGVSLGR